jgi:hypothetical protein
MLADREGCTDSRSLGERGTFPHKIAGMQFRIAPGYRSDIA